jgi:hypothetical protein
VFGDTTGTPQQDVLTPEDSLLRWITSCEVREITLAHENVAAAYIRSRDGENRRVRLGDAATADKVFATASQQRCPDLRITVHRVIPE